MEQLIARILFNSVALLAKVTVQEDVVQEASVLTISVFVMQDSKALTAALGIFNTTTV